MSIKILIPLLCFNYGRFLEDCLNSVINQTYEDWKIVIRDPNSKDDTEDIALNYVEIDDRIEYIKDSEYSTVGFARNKTIKENPNYDLICYHDVDDIMVEKRLELSVDNILNNDVIYGNMRYFEFENEVRRSLPSVNYEILLNGNHILAGTTCFKYHVWRKVGGFDEKMLTSSDYDFWMRVAANGFKFKYINKILSLHRIHSNNITVKQRKKQKQDAEYARKKHLLKKMSLKSKIIFYNARLKRYANKLYAH